MAKNHIDLPRYCELHPRDYGELQAFRERRVEHILEYLGSNFGTDGIENPINILSQFVNTVVRQLVGSNPRGLVTSFNRSLRPFAEASTDDMNRRLKKMRYDEILAERVVHAMFLIGIGYRAIVAPAASRFGGYASVVGQVGVCNIDFEDFCCDTSVADISKGEYQCHDYDAHLDDVKNCKLFRASMRKDIQRSEPKLFNDGGDRKVGSLNMRAGSNFERYEEYVRLRQTWWPRYRLITTHAVDYEFDEPLLEQDWVGPDCGPYEYLSLQQKAPGKLLAKAPIMDLVDVARSINHHWKHLDNQASQQKSVTGFQDEEDAAAVNKAEQGASVHLKNPQGVVPLKMFGVDQELALWTANSRELFNELSGTRALGGLSSSSKTATQEKLVAQSASELIQAWGSKVTKSAERDMDALGWFFWNNPHQKLQSTYQLPGMPDVTADRSVAPEDRAKIPWDEMDLEIDAYSLNHVPPGQRAQILDDMVKNVFIPFAPLFQRPGVGKMLEKYTAFKAKYHNMPEINELAESIIGVQGDPQMGAAEGPPQDQPMQPPGQETVHTRISQPGMTDKGQSQVLQQLMAGGRKPAGAGAGGLGQMGAA